jgi:hypothetical protein
MTIGIDITTGDENQGFVCRHCCRCLIAVFGRCMESMELLKSNRDGVCFCHQARDNEALIYSINVCSDRTHKTQDRYVHMHDHVADQTPCLSPRLGCSSWFAVGQGLKNP